MDARGKLFHANPRRAWVWLVLIWIALRGLNWMWYREMRSDPAALQRVMLFLTNDFIWTSVLIAAVGCRQAWAKYVLAVVIVFFIGADVVLLGKSDGGFGSIAVHVKDGLGRAAVLVVLLSSWDIKRLTSRVFE